MVSSLVKHEEKFAYNEWHRLNNLAGTWERDLKTAFMKTAVLDKTDGLLFRETVTNCVVDTAISTSRIYNILFNPSSSVWQNLVDDLSRGIDKVIDNESVRTKVKEILPIGLPLHQRRNRLNVYGLDERAAVRIERMWQDGASEADIRQARINFSVQRGNLISLTEINRVVNRTVETLFLQEQKISKADDDNLYWFDNSIPRNITSISDLPKKAKKEIVTRRDDRVCNYCEPLDGVKARVGYDFETEYGFFGTPPFHPRCRCFIVMSLR